MGNIRIEVLILIVLGAILFINLLNMLFLFLCFYKRQDNYKEKEISKTIEEIVGHRGETSYLPHEARALIKNRRNSKK